MNNELEAYDYLMDPTAAPIEQKRKGPNKFEKLGINFDPKYLFTYRLSSNHYSSPAELATAVEREVRKLNRFNTFLNVLRHLLLIPSNSEIA